MSVTLQLALETEVRLREKAAEKGQTLETYLEQFIERQAWDGNGAVSVEPVAAVEEELDERPWRGVFALPRPRQVLFSQEVALPAQGLPRREPAVNLSWHRVVADDE